MACKPTLEKQTSQMLLMAGEPEKTASLYEIQIKEEQLEELTSLCEEHKQTEEPNELVERQREERRQKEAEIKELKEELAQLTEKKHKIDCQVQKHSVYKDNVEQAAKLAKFEDVESFVGYVEHLRHFRDQLHQRESESQEQADQLRKALVTLQDQRRMLQLRTVKKQTQLQTELEQMYCEVFTWERKWNHIQQTAVKKTLLGQIKMWTLDIYKKTGGLLEGQEGVDMNDTEKQLDKIRNFIQDHEDILKQHQTSWQRPSRGQDKTHTKKRIETHRNQH
uniref:coiled-coil domain-containing protein 42 isoform X2 n=1 Tax=Monopterus albus TaxID=43700 RepID=UPI0009B3A2EB|nr:coiled-coil domain-containing protein 42 isoform X2 [Monopterus albus]